ncbi:exodeoxyribonuclease VII large subunit [Ilumatobacter sp.]|uniref:exodeoxyribonuclease VII large subunit n=1 Tax=Ilumatobacter sp. TaxID=1967498 RepID=UPI003AF7700C
MSQPAFDFGDEPADDPANPTYTVGELADAINDQLRRGFSDGVWVRGEIDGLRGSGPHTYFALVEHGDSGKAVMNVSLFAPMKRNLTPLLKKHRLDLANGMKVRIFGHLDYYAPNGRLGLKMAGIDPRFTLGELSQARDQVVRRLVASGLFDANRRHDLSPVPLQIGVVASVGTAAWHDFHDEIRRSGLGFGLAVCDTRVQGEWAAASVAASIRTLAARPGLDAVVVIRGGGARNELATFDAEAIALAIATSRVPVLTGLGHEVDRSVADEVAHTALKTPTACAAHLVDRVAAYRDRTEARWAAVVEAIGRDLDAADTRLADRAHRVARRTHAAVERADERLSTRVERLRLAPTQQLRRSESGLVRRREQLADRPPRSLDSELIRLDSIAARVATLDPAILLQRGWSITRTADGSVVRSVDQVDDDAVITTQVADGTLTSRIADR